MKLNKKLYYIIICTMCLIISILSIMCLIVNVRNKYSEYNGKNYGTQEKDSLHLKNISFTALSEITDELAIDIGNDVIKAVYGQEAINKTEYSLTYYEKDNAYMFSRNPKEEWVLGGGYEVIIRKTDGAILKVDMGN